MKDNYVDGKNLAWNGCKMAICQSTSFCDTLYNEYNRVLACADLDHMGVLGDQNQNQDQNYCHNGPHFLSKFSFWEKIVVILSVVQLVTTVIFFFSLRDKSFVKWTTSKIQYRKFGLI